jgi:predicted alpha/beta superfamily hydrolase
VYVPAQTRTRRCQLLVLHDGQNLFDPNRAFAHGQHWRVAETADALIAARAIAPLVICGIDHAGAGRIRELTPTAGGGRKGGGGSRYLRLIVEEVLPRIRRDFPVLTDRASTGMGGSSLGGLITLAAAVEFPIVFGKLLAMSPSVWWDRRVILRQIARRPTAFSGTRLWLDIGLHEGEKAVSDARRLAQLLGSLPSVPGVEPLDMRYVEDPDGTHSEASWAARLPEALRFLYGRPPKRRARRART